MSEPRVRTRAIDVKGDGVPQPTKEIIAKVQQVFDANKAKNKATREEGKFKKELVKMVAVIKGLSRFMVKCGDKDVEVLYVRGKKDSIDGAKLLKLVGDADRVVAIASFSQAAVKDAFGSNVLAQCLDTEVTDYAVSVKEYKD